MLAVRSIVHDLTGRQFGLLVVRRALARPYGRGAPFLICRCDGCGAAVFTTTHKLWRDHRTTWGNPRCRARLQQQQQRDPQSEHERISEMPVERRRLSSGNGAAPTLEARITRALAPDNATITSSAVAALFGEVETAITAAETAATEAKERALDPSIDDIEAARQHRDDCAFRLERLRAALPPLQTRYSELRKAERRTEWRADYAEVKAKRDSTAEKLQAIYELTEQLIDVLQEAKEVDKDVARINSTAPNSEHDRLLSVECAARGVNAIGPNAALSLMSELKLPHWSAPGWAWPPPTPPIDVRQVVPVKLMTHPSANWHEALKERDAERQRESVRVANYYRRQQREREDMDNAAAREAQARRQAAT